MSRQFDFATYALKMEVAKNALIQEMRSEGHSQEYIDLIMASVGLSLVQAALDGMPLTDTRYLTTMEYTLRLLKLHKELYEAT